MSLNVEVGQKAPGFSLKDENDKTVSLGDFSGKWVVVYFYPKDLTPGCTVEAIDFSAEKGAFEELNAVILGVSPDSVASHRRFCDKKDLTVTLLSDSDKDMLNQYGIWQLKKMMGREYMGVVRTTLLIDPEGVIKAIWEKVKVKGHVQDVLNCLKSNQNT